MDPHATVRSSRMALPTIASCRSHAGTSRSTSSSSSSSSSSRRRRRRDTLFSLPLDRPDAWQTTPHRGSAADYRWSTCTADTLHSSDDDQAGPSKLRRATPKLPNDDDGDDDDDEESATSASDAALDSALQSTMAALEAANALLLSTMATRTQLATLRAMESALEDSMEQREREIREQIDANRAQVEWKRSACRDIEAALFGIAIPPQRPTSTSRISWNGGSGFVSTRAPAAIAVGATQPAPHLAAKDDNATIGKSAAKRLERVLMAAATTTTTTTTGSETDVSGDVSFGSSLGDETSASSCASSAHEGSCRSRLVTSPPPHGLGLFSATSPLKSSPRRSKMTAASPQVSTASTPTTSTLFAPATSSLAPTSSSLAAPTTSSLFIPPNRTVALEEESRRRSITARSPALATFQRGHAAQSSVTSDVGLWGAEERRSEPTGRGALAALKRLNEQTSTGADRPISPRLSSSKPLHDEDVAAAPSTWTSSLASWVPVPRLGRTSSARHDVA